MEILTTFILVGFGGATGTTLRLLLCNWWNQKYPLGTLICNATGCLLLGTFSAHLPAVSAAFFGIGFCGSLTTVSGLIIDTCNLPPLKAVGNLCINFLIGLSLILVGYSFSV